MARALTLLTTVFALAACGSSTAATSAGASGSGSTSASTSTSTSTSTSATSAAGPACGPAAARTLASGPLSRVYVLAGRAVFGCTRGSAPRRLGITGPCQGPGTVGAATVAGRDVALVARACGVDTGSATVQVRRLTDGRTLSSHPAAATTAPESFTNVAGLVLAPDGTVAWIGEASSIVRHTATLVVYAAAPVRGAAARALDRGPGVAAGSLRLSGRTVSWSHGATRRHAQL